MNTQLNNVDRIAELRAEFWQIQSKFDKLGDFGFKVKAFSLTLTSAILLAVIANKVSGWVGCLALIGLMAFFLLEKYQAAWKDAMGGRCKEIAQEIRRLQMQRSVSEMKRIRKAILSDTPYDFLHAIDLKRIELEKWKWQWKAVSVNVGWLVLRANGVFYISQCLMILIVSATLVIQHKPAPPRTIEDGITIKKGVLKELGELSIKGSSKGPIPSDLSNERKEVTVD